MMLRSAGLSDLGLRRETNEDAFALAPELGLFLVADGMGGHRAGERASRLAVDAALEWLRDHAPGAGDGDPSPARRLTGAVAHANRVVFEAGSRDARLRGMGTTLVALSVGQERVAVAHVGDSRAYRLRDGELLALTEDHSVVAELVRSGALTPEAARWHPHRHVLSRALGTLPEVEIDARELSLGPGDLFVLCSDGLTRRVGAAEIGAALAPGAGLEAACRALVELANERGGDDNVTVVLVRAEAEPAAGEDRKRPRRRRRR